MKLTWKCKQIKLNLKHGMLIGLKSQDINGSRYQELIWLINYFFKVFSMGLTKPINSK